ncbi:MAG TPA: hypothetical protein VFB33_12885 [Candidatus Binataceae bacterium]|nr:hypothetical protein [Candidatus Binataceae bacterium]
MSIEFNTARGRCRLTLAAAPKRDGEQTTLMLAYERADGLERVGFVCEIAEGLARADEPADSETLLRSLGPWFAREFEQVREAALKSIRTERRPLVVRFDREHPGPFSRSEGGRDDGD